MKSSDSSPVAPVLNWTSHGTDGQRLVEALAEYHDLADSAANMNREAFLTKYADVREQLAGYLDCFDLIQAVAPQLQDPGEEPAQIDVLLKRASLGDFRILREIGRGGMGVVYEAEQQSVGRRVALKVLPFAAMLRSQQLERFRNEVRAAGCLTHPHIVAIYSVGNERGVHYYAMQLVDGHSLADVIAQLRHDHLGESADADPERAANPTAETQPIAALSTAWSQRPDRYWHAVARLGQQAAEALDYAHSCGVVHRDVKPANLLLGNDEHLWVADFGLARLGEDAGMTMSGDLVGTLRYMSPEQAAGSRTVDHRSDIYSLGATLYELLALRPAFGADDRRQLLQEVTHATPVPLRKVDHRIPVDLETIVSKAMEKDPVDRYATAAELDDDLQTFLERRTIRAHPPSLLHRLQRWTRRHAISVAATAATLLLAVIGLAGAHGKGSRNLRRPC